MTCWLKPEIVCLTVVAILSACAHGLTLDFPRLSFYSNPFITRKRSGTCSGNPCDVSKPFLCRDSPKCIILKYVCDGTWDCDDGFDEEPAMCNAASRPSVADLETWVDSEPWTITAFFNGADAPLIAHALSVAYDMEDLRDQVGMTDENVRNLRKALNSAVHGDERTLLDMGMDDNSWQEAQYVLQTLADSGFQY